MNRGVLHAAANESQLAGVLAHEIAHVAQRHAAAQVTQGAFANWGLGLLSAMLVDLVERLPRLETCVMLATEGSQAERIYSSLGFVPLNRQEALWGDRGVVLGGKGSGA